MKFAMSYAQWSEVTNSKSWFYSRTNYQNQDQDLFVHDQDQDNFDSLRCLETKTKNVIIF